MPEQREKLRLVHENLDTAYVNVGALLRYLRGREFAGRVRVELEDYDAVVFLKGKDEPRVVERDYARGRVDEGEAALHRLLVRAREPGGLVSVYEGEGGDGVDESASRESDDVRIKSEAVFDAASRAHAMQDAGASFAADEEAERRELLQLSGELMAAVERAASVAGGDFASAFQRARIQLADDFPFLDPMQRRFAYADGAATLQGKTSAGTYVSGVCEALRRTVEEIATRGEKIGVRRDVARELSTLARRRQTALAHFKFTPQLERIAGMRLL
ncbi:MAG TPA: hypothetical protein VF666_19640 [Pyrinomonadaceae bacterium]|jgi:hypothetical protein